MHPAIRLSGDLPWGNFLERNSLGQKVCKVLRLWMHVDILLSKKVVRVVGLIQNGRVMASARPNAQHLR